MSMESQFQGQFHSEKHSPLQHRELRNAHEFLLNNGYTNDDKEYEMDRSELFLNPNHSTISPQKEKMFIKEGRDRILESQPTQFVGDPLQSNLEGLTQSRYGRPNTNSPFPYLQKRNIKSKQLLLPSTAATSNMNQLMVINEKSSANGRMSGLSPSIGLYQQQSERNQESYLKQSLQKNLADSSSFQKGNQQNQSMLINMNQQFSDEFSPMQSSFTKNISFHNENITFNDLLVSLQKKNRSPLKQKAPFIIQNINQASENQLNRQSLNRNTSQYTNQQKDQDSPKPKKRKYQTDPNSPTNAMNETQSFNISMASNNNIFMNNQIIIGREMPIRLSGSKFIQTKGLINQGNFYNKSKNKIPQESLYKLSSIDDSINDPANGSYAKNDDGDLISYFPQTEEKNSSFLPRLETFHRFSNAQMQYRDSIISNRKDFQSKSDVKSPSDSKINEGSTKKSLFNQERKSFIHVNQNIADFNKQFKHQLNSESKNNKQSKLSNQNLLNINANIYNEISPKGNNMRDFSELYSLKNGIGKIQPVPEIKTQFNEQAIRGKIYRDKNMNSETPCKIDMSLISMTKSSNNKQYPTSEAISPKNQNISPQHFQFDHRKPVRVDSSKHNNKNGTSYKNSFISQELNKDIRWLNVRSFSQPKQASGLSEEQSLQVEKITSGSTQFHFRNHSISQGQKHIPYSKMASQAAQYNTQVSCPLPLMCSIEDGQLSSNDKANFLKKEQPSTNDNSNNENVIQEKKSDKLSSSHLGDIEQTSNSQLQKQFHHTIKTVASKQMPKCFRMNKQQLNLINRQQCKGSNTTTNNNQNRLLMIEGNPNKFDYTFVVQKPIQNNPRSVSNDARVIFNQENSQQYSTIQKGKNESCTPVRRSSKGNKNVFDENIYLTQNKISNDQLIEFDRERMTPAFNARQNYIGRQE